MRTFRYILILFAFSGMLGSKLMAQGDLAVMERAAEKARGAAKLEILNRIGNYYLERKDYEHVYDVGTRILSLAEVYRSEIEAGTPEGNREILLLEEQKIKGRMLIGQFHAATDDESKAVRLYRQAYRKAEEIGNTTLQQQAAALLESLDRGTGVQLNLGKVLETAVDEIEDLIPAEDRENLGEEAPSVVVREELGKQAERKGNYASAVEYYEGTLAYYEGKGDTATLMARYEKVINLYELLGNAERAEWYRGLMAHMRNPDGTPSPLASSNTPPPPRDLADIIETETNTRPQTEEEAEILEARDTYLRDAARYAREGDYESSYAVMLRAQALQKELFEMEQQRREDSLETAHIIDTKVEEIATLRAKQELQKTQRNLAMVGLIAVFVIAGLVTYLLFSKRKAHRSLTNAYDDLNETHEQLKTTQTQLVAAEKMASLGQLTAGIAHEINNPVNFISGNLHPLRTDIEDLLELVDAYRKAVLEKGLETEMREVKEREEDLDIQYLKEEIEDLLVGIEEGANRTTEIVSGLRNFARLDNEEYKRFNLHQGLDSTLALLRSHLEGIEILRDYADVPEVECYPGKLNQVFMNILTNALQAMPSGGMVNLTTRQAGDEVEICIRDTGMGMDEETLNRIFEPFFTTKDVGEGTGLGMSISHGIIRQHHGRIEASSQVGQGTEVRITLPINQPT